MTTNKTLAAQTRAFEALLAASGMPAELPPCGNVHIEVISILQRQLAPLNLLADVLQEHDMSPQDLLAAAEADPEGLRDFINANLPGMFGLN